MRPSLEAHRLKLAPIFSRSSSSAWRRLFDWAPKNKRAARISLEAIETTCWKIKGEQALERGGEEKGEKEEVSLTFTSFSLYR